MELTWKQFQEAVRLRLEHDGKPHLKPQFRDLHDIGKRIREVDDTLFVVRNTLKGRFEVHCLLHKPNTFAWIVPWQVLDGRVIEKARENRMERGGNPFLEVMRHNEEVERRAERDKRRLLNDAAREAHSAFRKLAYDPG